MPPLPQLDPAVSWLIAGVALALAEVVVPGVFLIWIGIAALVTGFATLLLPLPQAAQFAIFAIAAGVSVYLGRRLIARHPGVVSDPLLNDRGARMIGTVVTVSQPIEAGHGRVIIGDGAWNASGPDMPAGTRARVVGVSGTTVLVEPLVQGEMQVPGSA